MTEGFKVHPHDFDQMRGASLRAYEPFTGTRYRGSAQLKSPRPEELTAGYLYRWQIVYNRLPFFWLRRRVKVDYTMSRYGQPRGSAPRSGSVGLTIYTRTEKVPKGFFDNDGQLAYEIGRIVKYREPRSQERARELFQEAAVRYYGNNWHARSWFR